MNKINVEKVIDYTKVLKDNEVLQDTDKILRNENTNLKLEIERLNNIINELEQWLYSDELINSEYVIHPEWGEYYISPSAVVNKLKKLKSMEYKVGGDKE